MKTVVYKLPTGYEIFTNCGKLFYVSGKMVCFIGTKKTHVSTGRRLREIPNEIKTIFFNIQNTKQ